MNAPGKATPTLQPRIVRFRDAPFYLGMDRNRFNAEVRPYLTEVPIGKQGVGFDRLEMDAWLDDCIARNGRPAQKGIQRWDANEFPASSRGPVFGTSISTSTGGEFAKALDQLASGNGTIPREADGADTTSANLWRQAIPGLRASGSEIRDREPP